MEISENREMYLLSIATLMETGCVSPVPLNMLAEQLQITAVSANEMIRKLEEEGYVRYVPYKGVELLPQGNVIAQSVLRRRHLWEVFLVEKLNLTPQEADAMACRMEHITSPEAAKRLYDFLGQPTHSPMGRLIPPFEAATRMTAFRALSEVPLHEDVEIAQVAAEGAELAFLKEEGICPGAVLRKLASGSRSDLLVEVNGRKLQIGAEIANVIFVASTQDP